MRGATVAATIAPTIAPYIHSLTVIIAVDMQ